MHEAHQPDRAPGSSRTRRLLSWMLWIADFRGLRARVKAHYAAIGVVLPVAGLVSGIVQIAAPHARHITPWAVLAGASFLGLLAWIHCIAVPLVSRGELPDGRNLTDVLARRRMSRQLAHDRRQALRLWRSSPRYQPHSHQLPRSRGQSRNQDS
jgi:hypothetical protein